MKKTRYVLVLITMILFTIRNISNCQSWTMDYISRTWKTHTITVGSGFFYGVGETLQHHHSKSIFKNSKEKSFFGKRSWERKYKNYPVNKSGAFPLSKTSLVFLTDGYHLSKTLHRSSIFINFIFVYEKPIKKWEKWIDLALSFVFHSIGFHIEQFIFEPY